MTLPTNRVGSLPRSQQVVDFLFAYARGDDYDKAAVDIYIGKAVIKKQPRQKNAGIDIVSDGESAKISYAVYVNDRDAGYLGNDPCI